MKVNLYKSYDKNKICGACIHCKLESHRDVIFTWGEKATGICECPNNDNQYISVCSTVCDDFEKEEEGK